MLQPIERRAPRARFQIDADRRCRPRGDEPVSGVTQRDLQRRMGHGRRQIQAFDEGDAAWIGAQMLRQQLPQKVVPGEILLTPLDHAQLEQAQLLRGGQPIGCCGCGCQHLGDSANHDPRHSAASGTTRTPRPIAS